MTNKETILLTDGYKLGHHRQYPEGTEMVYSNWTPRSNKYFHEAEDGAVVFGLQYLIKEYLIKQFNENFFGLPREQAIRDFPDRLSDRCKIEEREPLCTGHKVPREGVVVRIEGDEVAEAFKLKSLRFLEREQKAIDKGEVDIEMQDNNQ